MFISIDRAAEQLGLSRTHVMNLVSSGQIRRKQKTGSADVHADDVKRVEEKRRREASRRINDPVRLARDISDFLHPKMSDGRKSGPEAIRLLSTDARAYFGLPSLQAAARPDRSGFCRTCWARMSVTAYGFGAAPQPSPEWRILLGEPCARDEAAWAAERASRAAERQRGHEDSARRRRQLADMQRRADLTRGTSLIEEGKRLVASATPQTGAVRLDLNGLQASAQAETDSRRRQIDEKIAQAVRQGQHAYARQLRALRKGL